MAWDMPTLYYLEFDDTSIICAFYIVHVYLTHTLICIVLNILETMDNLLLYSFYGNNNNKVTKGHIILCKYRPIFAIFI